MNKEIMEKETRILAEIKSINEKLALLPTDQYGNPVDMETAMPMYDKLDKLEAELFTNTATIEDFKVGTTLIDSEGNEFSILRKYDEGIWEARGSEGQGDKCVFDSEARFYTVK